MEQVGRLARMLAEAATILLIGVAVLILSAGFVWRVKILDVKTASMRPVFAPGDALFMRPLTAKSLKLGMMVTYHSSRNAKELVTHRVVRTGSLGFQTKGDALTAPDPPVRNSALVGEVVAVAPGVGRVFAWLQTWPGLICAVYVPAACVGVYELRRMEKTFKRFRLYRAQTAASGMIKV